jgi:hypothetical protein
MDSAWLFLLVQTFTFLAVVLFKRPSIPSKRGPTLFKVLRTCSTLVNVGGGLFARISCGVLLGAPQSLRYWAAEVRPGGQAGSGCFEVGRGGVCRRGCDAGNSARWINFQPVARYRAKRARK